MTKNPLVSIVLPTYNGSRYLDQAVQSCLNQTHTDWELIIVDDASTDDTPARIAKYLAEDGRIRSLRHETNRKLPGALNTGFSLAKGDYLTWTSDDNCYRPNAIAEMVAFLESCQDVDVVYTDYSEIDQEGRVLQKITIKDPEVLLRYNAIGPCFLCRRNVHETVGGYDDNLFLAEDYDFWLRASVLFRLQPLHKDLYLYRRHSDSLSAKEKERIQLPAERALASNLPHMNWAGAAARARACLRLARQARARDAWLVALEYYLLSLHYVPGFFFSTLVTSLAQRDMKS